IYSPTARDRACRGGPCVRGTGSDRRRCSVHAPIPGTPRPSRARRRIVMTELAASHVPAVERGTMALVCLAALGLGELFITAYAIDLHDSIDWNLFVL